MEQNIAGFSLSPQQQRVWSLLSLGQGNPCRVQGMITIQGEINPGQLKRSLQMVIAKHEILRTVFRRSPGVKFPFQVILENTASGWEEFEISNLGPAEQGAKLRELADQQRATAFDHELGPPVHGALCKLSASRHVLLLDISSLCADSCSLKNIAVDLARAYSTGSLAQDEVLQYADFVEWQNALLEAEETKAGRAYWQDYCRVLDVAGITSLCLPLERKPPAETAFEPSLLSQPVGEETVAKLEKSSVDIGMSPAEFLLACWNALLARLTGRSQLTVGFGCDGRGFEDLQSAVGLFHRYLPVQSQVEDELSFAAFAKRVKETLSKAVRWQECFIFEQLDTHTANSGFQYLPILFDYDATPPAERVGTLAFTLTQTYSCFDRFNIGLSCLHESGALRLTLEYDRHSYSLQAVENVASALSSVISAAANNPEAALCTLPILSERERERVVEEWNRTGAEYPKQTIPEMFAGQAARTPERTAVVSGEQRLSYAELNTRSNRLAHYLRGQGVGPDVPVGLCVERSVELMVGLMAILKAGGAYVPLNPDTPKLRLEQQLAGARVLLTQKKLLPQMPSWGGPILCLDNDEQLWVGESGENPVPLAKPEHLVYIIYTSGSTGVPKGVAVTHANLVNYSWFMQRRLELEKYPQGLQFATVSTLAADLGNSCIYPALISGGTLHLIPYEVATDSGLMAGYNRKQRIDVLKIVPSHLAALLSSGEAMQVLPGKYLVLGGEALMPGLVSQIRASGAECEVLNHYGPTETTVGSLTLWLGREWQDDGQSVTVPIGRPIANTRAYVLDRHQQPVPVGVVGELYIGGAGVARGYLDRRELTAERFLRDPFTQETGARMYRTGDLVRYRSDGALEFLGRGDDQVKVRGFRIELGEIEALLSECAGVRQVVVVARSSGESDKRLVAYLTVAREQAPTHDQLRHYLKDRLPEYMIPAAFVLLDKLPLNANGKIDRQALPAPEQASAKIYVPPRTPTEQVVASIWAEVLRCGPVSIEDNFFDLGGHSLLATQVVSRLRERFSVDLALRILFEKPTVLDIAQNIEQALQGGSTSTLDVIRPARQRGQTTGSGN